MISVEKMVNRIGRVLIGPREAFDVIVIEGSSIWEGIIISIIVSLGLASTIISYSESSLMGILSSFFVSFIGMFLLWVVFTFILMRVIQALYDVPGDYKDYFGSISYSLTSAFLPVSYKLITLILNISYLTFTPIVDVIIGFVWYFWLVALIYMFVKRYFKLNLKQFLAAAFISLIITGLIVAVTVVITMFLIPLSIGLEITDWRLLNSIKFVAFKF